MKLYALFICILFSTGTLAVDAVKVGVYDFPPYAFVTDKVTGITVQMLAEMNKFQDKFEFVPIPTTARRRYLDFEQNKFDMMIFESKKWGWQKYPLIASQTFVTGAEVYVTQAIKGRKQDFFLDLKNKSMIGVLGYHYQFADFNAEQGYLENNFNLIQTSSEKKVLELILNGRGDIAILPKEYLHYHFSHSPEDKNKLLISNKIDQIYRHTILMRKNYKVSKGYINNLLNKMKKKGILKPLWEKYGLVDTL